MAVGHFKFKPTVVTQLPHAKNAAQPPVTAQCFKVPLQNVIKAGSRLPPCSNSLVDPFPSRPRQRPHFSTIMDRNIYFDEAS